MSLPWNQHSKRQTRESYYIPYIVFRRKMSNELSFTQMTQTLSTLLRDLSELSMWVRTARGSYLPIHGIAAAVGPSTSHALPFIHSLSGRGTTSYSYLTGKKTCIKSSMPNRHCIGGLRRWRPRSRSDHRRSWKAGKIARGLSLCQQGRHIRRIRSCQAPSVHIS